MYRTVCVIALTSLAAVGCAADGEMAPGLSCVEGQSLPCLCDDGRSGAQSCLANGTFGACACETPAAASGAAAAAAPPAGEGVAGAAPNAGQGGEAPGDGTAGMGEPPADGTAGMGEPPVDGTAGMGEPPGDSGGSGSSELSGLFGYCEVDTDCEGERQCLMNGGATGYCADACMVAAFPFLGTTDPCQAPQEGGVPVSCAALTGLCTLGNCAGDGVSCPGEMQCVRTTTLGQSTGQCRYGD